jgi:hypothetical protein
MVAVHPERLRSADVHHGELGVGMDIDRPGALGAPLAGGADRLVDTFEV